MTERKTVLVVDDNRPLAEGFARMLSEQYEVRTAYDGTQACESFGEEIDAVLLDRKLPDISGDDLLSKIRDSDHDCGVAVVSAADPTPDLDCDVYLTKPVAETETIQQTVADLLDDDASA